MRVLICNKFYRPFGGPETQILESSRLLESDGHTVIPFSMAHEDNWPSEWSHHFVSEVDYHTGSGMVAQAREAAKIIYSLEAKRKMEALLDEAHPDIAHLHNIYHQLSPSILSPIKKRGIPIVLSLHDYKLACPNMLFYVNGEVCERCCGGRFHNAVTHKCVFGSVAKSLVCATEMYIHRFTKVYQRNVDIFISPSQFLIDAMKRCAAIEGRMVHIPALADIDSYTPSYDNDGYVLSLGKLTPEKGIGTLIRATAAAPGARLVVVGTGSQEIELKALADEEAPGRVQFTGFLTGEKLRHVVERSACFVIPSEWYENCPATVLEAYSAGKPVIGSRIGGIPELIDDGEDGFLFEPGNHEELAQKIDILLSDPSRMSNMGRAGRSKMERDYSRQALYRRLLEVYDSILQKP